MTAAGDTDVDITTVSLSAIGGVATYTGLSSLYTPASDADETYYFAANSGVFAEAAALR